MPRIDPFDELARYYDALMVHVNYDRWFLATAAISRLLDTPFKHLDAACGTGVLIKRLRRAGWQSMGADLSLAMLRAGRKENGEFARCAADLRALPFTDSLHYITCLFDSVNFLPSIEDVGAAFRQVYAALAAPGLFYFDIVTERMVLLHFAGPAWTEEHGRFSSTWHTEYSRDTRAAQTSIQINQHRAGSITEYMHPPRAIERALTDAGFDVLGVFDAETWRRPGRRTVRMDFVATKGAPREWARRFKAISADVRAMLAR